MERWSRRLQLALAERANINLQKAATATFWRGSQKISRSRNIQLVLKPTHIMAPSQQAAWRNAPDAEELERRRVCCFIFF